MLDTYARAVETADLSRPLRGVQEPEVLVRSDLAQWKAMVQQEVPEELSTREDGCALHRRLQSGGTGRLLRRDSAL